MGYRYAVLGSGRQGTAGACDVELAVPGALFVEEFLKRGFHLQVY